MKCALLFCSFVMCQSQLGNLLACSALRADCWNAWEGIPGNPKKAYMHECKRVCLWLCVKAIVIMTSSSYNRLASAELRQKCNSRHTAGLKYPRPYSRKRLKWIYDSVSVKCVNWAILLARRKYVPRFSLGTFSLTLLNWEQGLASQ